MSHSERTEREIDEHNNGLVIGILCALFAYGIISPSTPTPVQDKQREVSTSEVGNNLKDLTDKVSYLQQIKGSEYAKAKSKIEGITLSSSSNVEEYYQARTRHAFLRMMCLEDTFKKESLDLVIEGDLRLFSFELLDLKNVRKVTYPLDKPVSTGPALDRISDLLRLEYGIDLGSYSKFFPQGGDSRTLDILQRKRNAYTLEVNTKWIKY